MDTKVSSITITVGPAHNLSVLQSTATDTVRSVFVNSGIHLYGEEADIRALCSNILVALDEFIPEKKDSTDD
jgi:hypothetical protein